MTCLHGRRSRARPLFYNTLLTCYFYCLDFGSHISHLCWPASSQRSNVKRHLHKTALDCSINGTFFLPTISTRQRLFTTDITPKFSNFFDSTGKLSFDIFHARIGRSYRVPYGSRPHEETRDWADRDLDTREKRMGLLTCCLVFTPIIIIFFSSSTL